MVCLGKVLPCQWWLKCDLWRNRMGMKFLQQQNASVPATSRTADLVTHVHRSCCNDSGTGRLSWTIHWVKQLWDKPNVHWMKRYFGVQPKRCNSGFFWRFTFIKNKKVTGSGNHYWRYLFKQSSSPDLLQIDGWSLSTWPWHHSLPLAKPSVIPRQSHHSRHSGGHEAPNDRSLSLQKAKKNDVLAGNHLWSCTFPVESNVAFKLQLSWSYNIASLHPSGICNSQGAPEGD